MCVWYEARWLLRWAIESVCTLLIAAAVFAVGGDGKDPSSSWKHMDKGIWGGGMWLISTGLGFVSPARQWDHRNGFIWACTKRWWSGVYFDAPVWSRCAWLELNSFSLFLALPPLFSSYSCIALLKILKNISFTELLPLLVLFQAQTSISLWIPISSA